MWLGHPTNPREVLHFAFIVPDPRSFQSGGNLYNKQLIQALEREATIKLSCWHQREIIPKGANAYFIDTLFLDELDQWKAYRPLYLLVHHLESLFPPSGESAIDLFEQKERPLLEQFDGYLVTSTFTATYLNSKKLEKPIYCIPPALSHTFAPNKRSYEQVQAIMVANLIERKGIVPFLQELQKETLPSFQLSIFGNMDLEPAYAQKCLQIIAQLPQIEYAGELPQEELFQYYERSNLFISTAYMETFGMAIQEAKEAQLPLLILEGGYAATHLDKNAMGWQVQTIPALVQQLKKIALTPSLLKDLKRHPHSASGYNWQNAASHLIAFFKN